MACHKKIFEFSFFVFIKFTLKNEENFYADFEKKFFF
jgi:hypothetical protein